MNMRPSFRHHHTFALLFPMIAIGMFLLFYTLAALNYPGGSWVAREQEGFNFWHNYLCDLLDMYAVNGVLNTARFYAITALGLLFAGLFLLWSYLPRLFETKSANQRIMQISGFLSFIMIAFLALGNHDEVIRLAGFFGVLALITCIIELRKAGLKNLFLWGIICLLVFLTNYYIYETGFFIKSLPVIQKITFLLFIGWFICLDIALYRKLILSTKNAA